MDNFKTISVKMNGKETFISSNDEKKKETWKHSYDQQAASLEKQYVPEDLIEYEKSDDSGNLDAWLEPDHSFKRSRKIPPVFKVFGLAAISATVIGVTLGFIMLRMLAGIDDSGVQAAQTMDVNPSSTVETSSEDTNKIPANKGNTVSMQLNGMQAFILQGGIVSTKEQATQLQDQFAQAGYPTMVWQDDQGYRIFAGVSNEEVMVESVADSLLEANIESYVRPWETSESTVNIEESASTWLAGFTSMWKEALTTINNESQQNDIVTSWQEWLAEYPTIDNSGLEQLHQSSTKFLEAVQAEESKTQLQIYLLELWKSYDSIGKE